VSSEDYDAVIYDLDGTLVRLAVDWDAVAREVDEALRDRGVDTAGRSLWDMLELSDETGHREVVEETIAEHERAGARSSSRLPLADELPHEVPVGVCSLNCAAACHLALEAHDIDRYVDGVVGRDSIDTYKPDPAPLVALTAEFGVEPARTLFVGDSDSDATTAERASMAFQWAHDRQDR
jgi:phosphoglycolate phosphatase